MISFPGPSGLAEAIQLAVAPVFLLAGVGATLNVLASRIARIIDRARATEEHLARAAGDEVDDLQQRLRVLSRRATLISAAIALSVICGLLVSLVVTGLFVTYALGVNLAAPVGVAFVLAMLCMAAALLVFLREVFIAKRALSFGGVSRKR